MKDKQLTKADAVFSASALKAICERLRLRGDDKTADRIAHVAEVLETAETIHIIDSRRLS
jgi:hypothetical protein